jgi:hypothetical protein
MLRSSVAPGVLSVEEGAAGGRTRRETQFIPYSRMNWRSSWPAYSPTCTLSQ